ncbi:MAG: helix-turn-helix domain-containing protein [Proteobacteria bacterium]|nr:helix-turn-helix domain-containing protein [Pseudomonadota bacterium]
MTDFRKQRREYEVTQLEVARLSGIHPSKISILERGLVEARPDELERLHTALKLIEMRKDKNE